MSATLTISNLDESVGRKLRAQADHHGRSVETEAREIITRTVGGGGNMVPPADAAPSRQAFLDLLGSVEGTPDLSSKRGFEA